MLRAHFMVVSPQGLEHSATATTTRMKKSRQAVMVARQALPAGATSSRAHSAATRRSKNKNAPTRSSATSSRR
jgi:hypothetical protein